MVPFRRVLPRLRQSLPHAEALIVGRGQAAVSAGPGSPTGGDGNGDVPNPQTPLAAAALVVSPLRADAGFPVQIVEAMACGKPVIASPLVVDGPGIATE